jgi:predicted PurR-regulated permease PerM
MSAVPAWFWRAVLGASAIVVAVWWAVGVVAALAPLVICVLTSFLLACALEPPVAALAARGMRRGVATALCLAALFVSIGGGLALIAATTVSEAATLVEDLPVTVERSVAALNDLTGWDLDAGAATEYLTRDGGGLDQARRAITGFGPRLAIAIGWMLTGLLFVFYLVADGPRLRRWVCSLLPPRHQAEVLRAWDLTVDKAGGWLLLRAVLAVVAGVVSFVVFAALGVPYPAAMAVWVGLISQVIPVVGTYLAGALPVALALTVAPGTALAVLVFFTTYQQVENLLLAPRVARATLALHPAVGLGAVLAGGLLFGALGALLAAPVAAVIAAFVAAYLRRHDLIEHPSLPPDPDLSP